MIRWTITKMTIVGFMNNDMFKDIYTKLIELEREKLEIINNLIKEIYVPAENKD